MGIEDENLIETSAPDPYLIDRACQISLADSMFPARVLASAILRKLGRKMFGRVRGLQAAAMSNGITIFDQPHLHGGGLQEGQNYLRILNELGIAPCDRLFEFCAGPAYIGYMLLANGFCSHLVLADVVPDAVAAARKTARHNRIEDRVTVYCSDVFDGIPPTEKWDVVVGYPPSTCAAVQYSDARYFDPGYQAHTRFYAGLKRHMRQGGVAVVMESAGDVSPELFKDMISSGGGELVKIISAATLSGQPMNCFYVVSTW
jgi:hypothetical protein